MNAAPHRRPEHPLPGKVQAFNFTVGMYNIIPVSPAYRGNCLRWIVAENAINARR